MKLLSFVISVLNEEATIGTLYREIKENIPDGHDYQIIFVDDGSGDGSFGVMKNLAEADSKVQVIKFQRNFGKSAAIQKGFESAEGEIVFTLDADLQDNPKEIPKFLEKLDEGYDMVSGWKKRRFDPLGKTLPSKIFNFVVSKFFRMDLHDYNCGFKAYKKKVVDNLNIYGELHRYIPVLAKAKGFSCGEVVVEHRKREHGKSKYGVERYLRGFLDFLTIRVITKYKKSPIYFFGGMGSLMALAGFALCLYLLYIKYFLVEGISGRPLLMLAVLLSVIGVQFISIGLICELMVHMKDSKSDGVVIDKVISFSKNKEII